MKELDLSKLNWRETWDLVDSVYLQSAMELDVWLSQLALNMEEYLELRKSQLPAPMEVMQKALEILENEESHMPK